MKNTGSERRKEPRYPIEARVLVHKNSGQTIPATAANISGNGMLLHVDEPSQFRILEELSVEIELPDDPCKPFSAWGIAKVVRINGRHFGIELRGGTFDSEN
jgi:hypothetical protein